MDSEPIELVNRQPFEAGARRARCFFNGVPITTGYTIMSMDGGVYVQILDEKRAKDGISHFYLALVAADMTSLGHDLLSVTKRNDMFTLYFSLKDPKKLLASPPPPS